MIIDCRPRHEGLLPTIAKLDLEYGLALGLHRLRRCVLRQGIAFKRTANGARPGLRGYGCYKAVDPTIRSRYAIDRIMGTSLMQTGAGRCS